MPERTPRIAVPQPVRDAVDAAMADRDAVLAARLTAMEEEGHRTGKILNGLLGQLHLRSEAEPGEDERPVQVADIIWSCQKCGSRLGFYDQENDVLRLRYKEHVVHVHAGLGGWTRVVCRQCGELNVVEYAPSAQAQAEGLPEVQVHGDQLVLDEPLLAELLALVQARDGSCVLRLVQAPDPDPR